MAFGRIMALCEFRNFLISATSIFKTTEGFLLKLRKCLWDHNLPMTVTGIHLGMNFESSKLLNTVYPLEI
jgi:hypothetical protein